jgi:hypothetical protein
MTSEIGAQVIPCKDPLYKVGDMVIIKEFCSDVPIFSGVNEQVRNQKGVIKEIMPGDPIKIAAGGRVTSLGSGTWYIVTMENPVVFRDKTIRDLPVAETELEIPS